MLAHLDRVPLREASMEPHEVLASESQERMLAIVTPEDLPAVLAIADKWGVLATAIGEVVEGDRLVVQWHGEVVVDVPPGSLADDGPVYERPIERPADQDDLLAARHPPTRGRRARRPAAADGRLAEPVQPPLGGRAVRPDRARRHRAGLAGGRRRRTAVGVRPRHRAGTDGNGRYARLDPYAGAQLALAEAYRNVAATGACRSR
jgi:phosphoribosylformylglycinamidine synthase